MKTSSFARIASATLLFSVWLCNAAPAAADETAKPSATGSTKPNLGKGPAVEKSLPSSAPPATTTRTTGATDQDNTVKAMNSKEKAKVEIEGK